MSQQNDEQQIRNLIDKNRKDVWTMIPGGLARGADGQWRIWRGANMLASA